MAICAYACPTYERLTRRRKNQQRESPYTAARRRRISSEVSDFLTASSATKTEKTTRRTWISRNNHLRRSMMAVSAIGLFTQLTDECKDWQIHGDHDAPDSYSEHHNHCRFQSGHEITDRGIHF